ncbi:DsbA family protein [Amphritea opalescens]|uniref:DsbA family protein n=1 Tax=Amphritea opalescens TaxID=2490544 RepID=A0A430KQW5_9GAMM|nr:DsbA family protein [Amphritea opalescens]RTE65885.1 DsbA family protein [Amphritea opalescens]
MTLIYVMDPMCSWCYAFQPQLKEVMNRLRPGINMVCYMGGLAPDSDQPMPKEMQQAIAQTWHSIEQRTGAQFNYEFWDKCQPRRSTYPACRAVISAEQLTTGSGMKMTEAIQQAYYQQAKNPSDLPVLADLAETIGLDREQFIQQMASEKTAQTLFEDLSFCQQSGIQGFPFLGVQTDNGFDVISTGYCDQKSLLQRCTDLNLI